jgi:hypothetical protein
METGAAARMCIRAEGGDLFIGALSSQITATAFGDLLWPILTALPPGSGMHFWITSPEPQPPTDYVSGYILQLLGRVGFRRVRGEDGRSWRPPLPGERRAPPRTVPPRTPGDRKGKGPAGPGPRNLGEGLESLTTDEGEGPGTDVTVYGRPGETRSDLWRIAMTHMVDTTRRDGPWGSYTYHV